MEVDVPNTRPLLEALRWTRHAAVRHGLARSAYYGELTEGIIENTLSNFRRRFEVYSLVKVERHALQNRPALWLQRRTSGTGPGLDVHDSLIWLLERGLGLEMHLRLLILLGNEDSRNY